MGRFCDGKVKGHHLKTGVKMKALFINPDWDGVVSKKGGRFNRKWPPLCLLNCIGLLEKHGIEAGLIDLRAQRLLKEQAIDIASRADMVFVTSSLIDRWQCPNIGLEAFFNLLVRLRKDNLYIMGAHGTMFPEEILKDAGAKAVIRGEPEFTVLELCMAGDISKVSGITFMSEGQAVNNADRPLSDLNELPAPAYHHIDMDKYQYELLGDRLALLETSRGCPFSCIYCYQGMYGWRRIRRKYIKNVTAEIDYLIKAVGAKSLYFIDLEFTLDKDFVRQICDYIISKGYDIRWCCQTRADTVDALLLKKMKEAGCRLIHYGVETGSERVMNGIGKKIKLSEIEDGVAATMNAGIEAACFFMFGFPGETKEDMEATIKFALSLNPAYASFHIAAPYYGTELYKMACPDEPFPEACAAGHSPDILKSFVRSGLRRFYMRPSYILSRILRGSPGSWKRQAHLFLEFMR